MKALIVSNGKIENMELLSRLSEESDLIICADGGALYIDMLNKTPHILIGDFDSISDEVKNRFLEKEVQHLKFPSKKDKTDTELAVDYAVEKGANEIILIGATGTRLDHTLGNIMLLHKILRLGIKGVIIDDNNEIFIINDKITLQKDDNYNVSIIPITEYAKGVTLKGFEYETIEANLNTFSTIGISNKIKDKEGSVSIREGICLVIKSKD